MCILCSFQVLLLVDASFGFEMETFEFLNILQAHGFPKVMGVLTHLDMFKNQKALKKIKKALKQRFWTEVQQVGCACNNIIYYYVPYSLEKICHTNFHQGNNIRSSVF